MAKRKILGRILVVDDDPAVVASFGLVFAEKDCEVRGAATAQQALFAVETEKFDLIFLDNVLPGRSGLHAIAELRRKSSAPILMMTGHFDPDLKKDALLLGAADCLAKPIDFRDLAPKVLGILAARPG